MRNYFRHIGFALILLSATAYATPPVATCQLGGNASGLLCLLHFNISETPQPDASGNGITGTVTDATFTTGKFSGAYTFATTNKIALATTFQNNPSTGTFSAWIYPTSAGTATQPWETSSIWCKGDTYWAVCFSTDSKIKMTVYQTDLVTHYLIGTKVLSLNAWHYVVITYDINGSTLYVDGALDISSSNITPLSINAGHVNGVAYIGLRGSGNLGFPGRIDEVAFYNRLLPLGEIYENYHRNSKAGDE